ncbi:MAG: YceI family protein [Bacteroidales bacterium]|nr:YceI family protein [Bacteroidales bacterium]
MKKIFLLSLVIFSIYTVTVSAQKYITRNGYVGFFSHTPVEDIKADNNQVASILDTATGEIAFQVLIRSFRFPKALMQEHFNENYMESDKFPRSTFSGKIANHQNIDFTKSGSHEVTVDGELTIRDVTKRISVKGTLEPDGDKIKASAKFNISPEDYNIKIPAVVRNNIARIIEVTVQMNYAPGETR